MTIRADLHNHSCLSPCGSLDNSPIRLVKRAAELGTNLLALTDHNSTRNTPAFAEACRRFGVIGVFGTETTTREEVHVLSLFRSVEEAADWGDWVYRRLPDVPNRPDLFGEQVVVDVDETVLDFEPRYLIPAIEASIDEIAHETLRRGGLVIPAHIDRPVNSVYSQLGFLPDLPFSAVETTVIPPPIETAKTTVICDSDAHYPDDIGRRWFSFEATVPSFDSLAEALRTGAVNPSIAPAG